MYVKLEMVESCHGFSKVMLLQDLMMCLVCLCLVVRGRITPVNHFSINLQVFLHNQGFLNKGCWQSELKGGCMQNLPWKLEIFCGLRALCLLTF